MGWPCIYSGCPTSWTVTRGPSHWKECFLFYPISDLVQDIERVIYLKIIFPSLLIMFDPIGWAARDLRIILFSVPVGIFP